MFSFLYATYVLIKACLLVIASCAKQAFSSLTINVGVTTTKSSPPTLKHSTRVALHEVMAGEQLQNARFAEFVTP
ncbi:hypothetical protein BDA96_07G069800 [Sorghum bicolor]|uniref:Secreted protein n=1 Tax=Sorghum bicolor TaxID=4558 RepID=A0A921QIJ5_SORBI|nr:hypothetical protein BDA96_07G069800 [Sorghum bicolor]